MAFRARNLIYSRWRCSNESKCDLGLRSRTYPRTGWPGRILLQSNRPDSLSVCIRSGLLPLRPLRASSTAARSLTGPCASEGLANARGADAPCSVARCSQGSCTKWLADQKIGLRRAFTVNANLPWKKFAYRFEMRWPSGV